MSTMPSGSSSSSMSGFQSAISQAVREHWKLFLVEGIILVILGILAIIIPPLASIGITIFIGWLFLISGIAGLITTFGARHAPGFWWFAPLRHPRHCRRHSPPRLAGERRRLAHPPPDRVLRYRRRPLHHVCARA